MTRVATIFALSSAPGRAGVAVVRVSGPDAAAAVTALAGDLPRPRFAALRRLRNTARDVIDEALVLWFPGPKSETGEDMAEFQVHGSRAVIAALFEALGAMPGFRLAEPGEFARRAFHNGKMDLTTVEGLADLIDAETELQRRQAMQQASGGLARLYEGWRHRLLEAMGLTEAAIDFSDEGDVAAHVGSLAQATAGALADELSAHLAAGHRGEIIRDGFRVVLAGAPNVGKSSLMNALARRDVAIVSEEAGTTRDVIEVRLDLAGLAVVVSDTAGLRESAGAVEREGIRRTWERLREAGLVLWVVDGTEPETPLPEAVADAQAASRVLVVLNKADAVTSDMLRGRKHDLAVSAKTGAGLDDLARLIGERAAAAVGFDQLEPVPSNQRHRALVGEALGHVQTFLAGNPGDVELRAEDLRLAAQALGRLTGRIDPEDVLGVIFGRFCIGK